MVREVNKVGTNKNRNTTTNERRKNNESSMVI